MNKDIKHLGMLYENILLELNRQKKEMVKKGQLDPSKPYKQMMFNYRGDKKSAAETLKQQASYGKFDPNYKSVVGKKFLVRCVKNFTGIYANEQGEVIFHRNPEGNEYTIETDRKTVHFTINGAVSDHTFNTWENAMIAFIVDPAQVKGRPRSTRFEDTWYVVDNKGILNVGKATVLVPEQTQIPENFKNVNVVRYNGNTVEDRNNFINKILVDKGAKVVRIGSHGAELPDNSGFNQWKETQLTAKELNSQYEDGGPAHAYSIESGVEEIAMRINIIRNLAKQNNLSLQDFKGGKNSDIIRNSGKMNSDFDNLISDTQIYLPKISNYLNTDKQKIDKNTYFYLLKSIKSFKEFLREAGAPLKRN